MEKKNENKYELLFLSYSGGTEGPATATIKLRVEKKEIRKAETTDFGPVHTIIEAIKNASGIKCKLVYFGINNMYSGSESPGVCTVILQCGTKTVSGEGNNVDILKASGYAYVDALNNLYEEIEKEAETERRLEYPIDEHGQAKLIK